jgi:hypothetical protein
MNVRPTRSSLLCCAATLGLAAPLAMAWGPEGHAIVADIAQRHLAPAAAAQVADLLRLEGLHRLDQVASWADQHRKEMPETGAWHYVDIPLAAPAFDAARDCAQDNCIVAKLEQSTRTLADHSATPAARLEALKWVVHLAGDIHQPMHAVDHDDKGGNTVQVQFFGVGTNLHSVWDGRVIEHALGLQLGPDYAIDHAAVQADAMQLDARITPAERAQWAPAGSLATLDARVVGWANESHRLAQQVAYTDLAKPSGAAWSGRYQARAWPVIRTRLEQGGVRLAELLDEALGGPASKGGGR